MALENSYIDTGYFVGDISIPNITSSGVVATIEELITRNESQMLTDLFGYRFFDLLYNNTNFNNDPIDGTSLLYTTLIQGDDYVASDGRRRRYEGLTGEVNNVSGGFLRSPIANYCYWHWLNQNQTQTVGTGVVVAQAENSVKVAPASKMVNAWNKMVDSLWVMHDYITVNKTDYPDYIGFVFEPIRYPVNFSDLEPNQKLFVKQNPFGL